MSYKYEATGIPVSFFFNMLTWLSLPAVMLVTSKPWMSGIVSGVDYLMVAMMPMMLAKLYMTISVDLFGYKNMMISKRKIQAVVNEPEETGSMEPFQTATHEINFDNVDFSYVPGEPVLKPRHLYGARPEAHCHCRGLRFRQIHHSEPDCKILRGGWRNHFNRRQTYQLCGRRACTGTNLYGRSGCISL